ncbi:MAG: CHAT domain-containing protein [Gemmatimonadota bacterium]
MAVALLLTWSILQIVGGSVRASSPRAVVDSALAAVEADKTAALETTWRRRGARDVAALLGRASLARLSYRFEQADTLYASVIVLRPEPRDRFRLSAQLGQGYSRQNMADLRGADSIFAIVIAAAADSVSRPELAEALLSRAIVMVRLKGMVAAGRLVDHADSIRPPDDSVLLVRTLCTRSAVRLGEAVPYVASAAKEGALIAARHGWRRLEAACRTAWFLRWEQQGYIDSASAALSRVADLQRAARDYSNLAVTLQRLGWMKVAVGDYGVGRRDLLEAVSVGRASRNLSPVAWAESGLASLALVLGDMAGAAVHAGVAESLMTSQGDQLGLANVLVNRTDVARLSGDLPAAHRIALRYRELTTRFGAIWVTGAYRLLGSIAADERDWPTATAYYDSTEVGEREGRQAGALLDLNVLRASMAYSQGQLDQAERLLVDGLARTKPGQVVPRYQSAVLLAQVALKRGQLARAESVVTVAGDSLDRWRAGLTDEQLRRAIFDSRGEGHHGAQLTEVVAGLARGGRAEAALALAERRRARHLFDQMVQAQGLRPSARVLGRQGSPLPRPPLDSATAVVEYVTGRESPIVAFVVARGATRAVALAPGKDVFREVERFVGLLGAGANPRSLAASLGSSLLEPVVQQLPAGITRLVIVPDVGLHQVPFDALLVDGHPAGARFAVSVVPSIAVLSRLMALPRWTGTTRVLAFGDPQLRQSGGELRTVLAAVQRSGGLPRLAASSAEVRDLASLFPGTVVRVGRRASEAELKRQPLRAFRIIHLATHAIVSDWSADATALVLASGQGEDGLVRPGDFADFGLAADLVVLSACRTARGVTEGGEGVQGLTAALLEGGARTVLASQWAIDDHRTAVFMGRFYRALRRGIAVTDALAEVKRMLAAEGRPAQEWAGFVLVGDPMVRIEPGVAR